MGLLFRNWLEEGFYEEDGLGDMSKIEDISEILEAHKKGKLYRHDGMGLSLVRDNEEIKTHLKDGK